MSLCLLKLATGVPPFSLDGIWRQGCLLFRWLEFGDKGASCFAGWNWQETVCFLEEGMSITDGAIGFE
jgi:hypothetical protein